MDRMKRNLKPRNILEPIDETNENSYNYSTQKDRISRPTIQTSLRKRIEEDKDEVDYPQYTGGFSKLPRYLSSVDKENMNSIITETRGKGYQSLTNTNDKFEENYKRSSFFNTPYGVNTTPSPKKQNIYDCLVIKNFPINSLQKVINEFKRFGEIKTYNFDEIDITLIIEYTDPVTVLEAYKNHNPYLIDNQRLLQIYLAHTNELQMKNYLPIMKKTNHNSINSPSVSIINHVIDFLFNW
jgi:hypothetical protein